MYKDRVKQLENVRRLNKLRYHARRKEWFERMGGKCSICPSSNNLEVDHIDPSKKFRHRIWTYSDIRREKELKKCQPLCRECHLKKTLEQREKTQHGTGQMYQVHKCRCLLCVAYKKSDNAKRRKCG